ncbi:MAG TPA: hypothetical protein VF170_06430, partial [Planctomycetaceae bacterium]
MTELTSGIGAWLILSLGLAAADPRPPVEAARPERPPVEAARPDDEAGARDSGPNSGGPGSPSEEGGAPAPAAEPEEPPQAGRKGLGGVWGRDRSRDEKPIPVLPLLVGTPEPDGAKPGDPKPDDPKPVPRPGEPRRLDERPVAPAAAVARPVDPLDAEV